MGNALTPEFTFSALTDLNFTEQKGERMTSQSENIMGLQKLVMPYKKKKDSGLLSVKVEGYEHLIKIYFDLGLVVGLSMGNLKNDECLSILGSCKPKEATFMKGYKAPDFCAGEKSDIDHKLEEMFSSYPVRGAVAAQDGEDKKMSVRADLIVKLEAEFINIIGPIGKMIIDSVYSEIGYQRGADMASLHYTVLIDRLRAELPEQHQATFSAKYAIGLAL